MRIVPRAWRTLNTDFPDHFLAASLVHERYDNSRIYEWIWFERQKDYRAIDERIVNLTPSTAFSSLVVYPLAGMIVNLTPSTAFSSLVVYPLAGMPALAAKHCW